jgi:hypothetical protein
MHELSDDALLRPLVMQNQGPTLRSRVPPSWPAPPDATHSVPMEYAGVIDSAINTFVAADEA